MAAEDESIPFYGPPWARKTPEFERAVLLTDAVIAIALTILALELKVPILDDPHDDLWHALTEDWSTFFTFFLTFAIIANSWLGHHRFVSRMDRIDGKFLAWNFVYLSIICVMPFGTALVGRYAADTPVAVALYLGLIIVMTLTQIGRDVIAVRRDLLYEPGYNPWIKFDLLDSSVRAAMFLPGIAIAYVAPDPTWGLLWLVFYAPVAAIVGRGEPKQDVPPDLRRRVRG